MAPFPSPGPLGSSGSCSRTVTEGRAPGPDADDPGDGADRAAHEGSSAEIRTAVDVLLNADVGVCDSRELEIVRGASQRLRGFVASIDLRVARRNDELLDAWLRDPSGNPDHEAGHDPADPDTPGDGTDDDAPDSGDGPGAPGPDAGGGSGAGPAGSGTGSGRSGAGGVGDPAGFGATTDRRSDTEIARDRGRSQVCASMPAFETALAAGRIDIAHIDAVVAALARIDIDEVRRAFTDHADELVGYATVERPERFRRRCNDLVRRLMRNHGIELSARQKQAARSRSWWDQTSGMFHLHLELDPETGAKVETAIEQHIATRRQHNTGETWERLRVEAITELITASTRLDPRSPEIVVLIDHTTLRDGLVADGGMCETSGGGELSPDTVRRLACDAGILPIVMNSQGVPIDVGRKERTATTAQRRALRAMYRTCAHPTCTRPFTWCRIHHIVFWDHGGPTNLDHLLPLCDEHHHQVHEGRWTLTMTPNRVCTWTTPGGVIWYHGDTRDGVGSTGSSRPTHVSATATHDPPNSDDPRTVRGETAQHSSGPVDRRRRCADEAAAERLDLFAHDTEPSGP